MPSPHVRPDRRARPEYVAAFREIVGRIGKSLTGLPRRVLPIRMYVAGGAALHIVHGVRSGPAQHLDFFSIVAGAPQ